VRLTIQLTRERNRSDCVVIWIEDGPPPCSTADSHFNVEPYPLQRTKQLNDDDDDDDDDDDSSVACGEL